MKLKLNDEEKAALVMFGIPILLFLILVLIILLAAIITN